MQFATCKKKFQKELWKCTTAKLIISRFRPIEWEIQKAADIYEFNINLLWWYHWRNAKSASKGKELQKNAWNMRRKERREKEWQELYNMMYHFWFSFWLLFSQSLFGFPSPYFLCILVLYSQSIFLLLLVILPAYTPEVENPSNGNIQ